MNRKHLDQALAQLADALESQDVSKNTIDPLDLVTKIPDRSINGNQINGGKILNFSSSGIKDNAKKTQITISEDGTHISKLSVDNIAGNLNVDGDINAKTVSVDILIAKELKADIQLEKNTNVEFNGDNPFNKGLLWKGHGNTKQFILNAEGDKFFSSETIDVHQGKHYSINGTKVLDDKELGSSITKSNIRELGRLKGLAVDGDVIINSFLFYNSAVDRIGLGTEEPKAAITVAEDMIEVSLGTKDSVKGFVGTHQNAGFDIVTGDITRISIAGNGNIQIGNQNTTPAKISVHGTMGVNVSSPDDRVDLHVNGAIRFNDTLHLKGNEPPKGGAYNKGDIVWNSEPDTGRPVGWICTKEGAPGVWKPFGAVM